MNKQRSWNAENSNANGGKPPYGYHQLVSSVLGTLRIQTLETESSVTESTANEQRSWNAERSNHRLRVIALLTQRFFGNAVNSNLISSAYIPCG
jgi:hypothetical protein